MMDRQTDRQTHGENNMSPDPEGGRHNFPLNIFNFYNLKNLCILHGGVFLMYRMRTTYGKDHGCLVVRDTTEDSVPGFV